MRNLMIEAEINGTLARRSGRSFLNDPTVAIRLGTAAVAGVIAIIAVATIGSVLAQEAPPKGSVPASDAEWLAKELSGGKAADASSGALVTQGEPGIRLGLAQAADLSPIYPTNVFRTNDKHIAVLFRLGDSDRYKKLTATFTAVDVGTALPPGSQVARGSMSVKPGASGIFYASMMRSPGKYKVDVFGDNQPWKSAEFSIVQAGDPIPLKNPGELVQLNKGRTLTYAFTQEIGNIGKVTDVPPGVTKGPDGKYHGEMKASVIDADSAGAHLQFHRGGELVLDEWWQVDNHGLAATKRIAEGNTVLLDPPQIIWKLPLKYTGDWTYTVKEQKIRQKFQQWGPLPVKTPSGEEQGYIVLLEQSDGAVAMTVERHFVPGVGMVRQIYTTALRGKLVSREEMVLTGVQ